MDRRDRTGQEKSDPAVLSGRRFLLLPVFVLLLLLFFNIYALTKPFFHEPSLVLEWRKGPLIYDSSPYSTMNAAKFFWPVSALVLDVYLIILLIRSVFPRRKKNRGSFFEGLFTVSALLLVLAGGEGMTRLLIKKYMFIQYRPHPDMAWYNRPNLSWHSDNTDESYKSTNSLGFRMTREIAAEKRPEELRIFLTGDSSTFGYGMDDGDNYSSLVETLLSERTGKRAIVINTACPGHTSLQGLHLLHKYGAVMEPDMLIWAYNNDSCLDTAPDLDRIAGTPSARAVRRMLYKSDYYLLLRRVLLDFIYSRKIEEYQSRFSMNHFDWVRRIPFDDYKKYLEEFADFARERKIGILFIRMPLNRYMSEIQSIYMTSFDENYRDYLEVFCEEEGLPFLDLEQVFVSQYSPDLFLPGHLFHPSVRGHRIVAEQITQEVERIVFDAD